MLGYVVKDLLRLGHHMLSKVEQYQVMDMPSIGHAMLCCISLSLVSSCSVTLRCCIIS